MANSSQLALPIMIAPAFFNNRMTVASYGGMNCASIFDPAVDRKSFVRMTSLTAMGMPQSGGGFFSVPKICSAVAAA